MGSLNHTIRRTLGNLNSPVSQTDGQLLARFVASQDKAAFEDLVRRHGPMVLRVCRRVLHHAQDAEDAFQATFIVFLRKAESIAKQEAVASWLYGVAYRVALEAKTLASKRHAREKGSPETVVADNRQPAAPEPRYDDVALVLDEELQRLPEKYRAAIVLCYLEGQTTERAAQQLHCQTDALKKRMERGRAMLRHRLRRRGLALPAGMLATLMAAQAARAGIRAGLVASVAGWATNPAAGAKMPAAAVALAEAVLREMGRWSVARWSGLLGLAVLGTIGIIIGVWSTPNATEKSKPTAPSNTASLNAFTQVNVSVRAGNGNSPTGPFLYCHAIPVGTANTPPVPIVWYFGWTTFPTWDSIQSTTSQGEVKLGAPGDAVVKMYVTYRNLATGARGVGYDVFTCQGLSYNGNGIAAQGTVQVDCYDISGKLLASSPKMPVTVGSINAQ